MLIILFIVVVILFLFYLYIHGPSKKKESYSDNFNKESFFYYDKIEDSKDKTIISIDTSQRYAFYMINLSAEKYTQFSNLTIPTIVYYKDTASKDLFSIVCKIFDKDIKNTIFEKQNMNEVSKKRSVLYLAIVPTSEFVELQSKFIFSLYKYNEIDPKKLNVLLPYAAILHQNIKPSTEVFKFIHFDTCIYQNSKKYTEHKLETDVLVKNFYNMLGYKFMVKKQVTFSDENQVKIYYKDRVTFTIDNNNISGKISYMKGDYTEFIALETIDDVIKAKVNIGDIIILKAQSYEIENNKYYYLGNNKLSTAFPLTSDVPYKKNDQGHILYKSGEIYYIDLYDRVYFTNLEKHCIVFKKYTEKEIINLECSIINDKDKEDYTNYECVTNPNIKFKDQCESVYELTGVKKTGFDVWDKRCKNHTDCPFFSLDNYKGKCNDNGYCEMPLGVKNIGYRKYLTGSDSVDCPYKDIGDKCIF
jgi:hypothetical protein